jgi:hypothetical protein
MALNLNKGTVADANYPLYGAIGLRESLGSPGHWTHCAGVEVPALDLLIITAESEEDMSSWLNKVQLLMFQRRADSEHAHLCISRDSSSSSLVRLAFSYHGDRQSLAKRPFFPQLRQVSRPSFPLEFFFRLPRGRFLDPPLPEPNLELPSPPGYFSFMRACH